jgi:hypothetical protein
MPEPLLTRGDVAAWLRHPEAWLRKHKARLERQHGFPAPLPIPGAPRWDPVALRLWAATIQGLAPDRHPREGGDLTPPLDDAAIDAMLGDRFAAIADGMSESR